MPLSTGQVIHNNRYRIDALLGQGGMGAVYRAWDMSLSIPVAIKENLDASPEAQKQFGREAHILARLSHPNLPRVTDYFFVPGQGQYLVMDFVEGEDLRAMLNRLGVLPEPQVLNWTSQVCDALAYLHSQPSPIIHRDIKPANIKIRPDGRAMLVDFGIAKVYDPHLATTIGAKAVTPGYSPPEQYGGGTTDARSDIYALGATVYHLLTGRQPPESVHRMVGSATLPPPRQLNQRISPMAEQAILKAVEVPTDRRFQNVNELKASLTQPVKRTVSQPPKPVTAPTQAIAPRRKGGDRSVLLLAGGVVVAFVLVALIVALVFSGTGRATPTPTTVAVLAGTSEPTATLQLSPTDTPPPTASLLPTATTASLPPAATDTPWPTEPPPPMATDTPRPTEPPPPTPTNTPTQTPEPPTLSGARVNGMVVWGTVPVPGARIELKESGNYYSTPVLAQTIAGADGRFALENPPIGDYTLYAVSPSDDYWQWTGRTVKIRAGETVEAGTFYLSKKLQLLEPASGTTVGTTTPTLRWQSFPGTALYHVDLFNDETGEPVLRQDTTETSLAVSPPLVPGRRYQWSVYAMDAARIQIAYYSAWVFTVQP
jgi:serine/threonine protein kinase